MTKPINWGIIGLGKVANRFAQDLQLTKDAVLLAVASRTLEKAKKFSEDFKSIRYYGAYEDLINDPEVDVVYIATPHVFHFENTMACLRNGKAVLCEKPMGMNADQVRKLIAEAQSQQLFLMEGLWTRFIPATEKLIEMLESGLIGQISSVRAGFGFKAPYLPESRLYNRKLGGGSLLDVGIYPLYISLLTLGLPVEISAKAAMTDTGVDGYCSVSLKYENGATSNLVSAIQVNMPTEAHFYGSEGSLKLHHCFHQSEKVSLKKDGQEHVFDRKYRGNGYIHEIEEVNKCLNNGEKESAKLPLKISLSLISLIDKVRAEIGLSYEE